VVWVHLPALEILGIRSNTLFCKAPTEQICVLCSTAPGPFNLKVSKGQAAVQCDAIRQHCQEAGAHHVTIEEVDDSEVDGSEVDGSEVGGSQVDDSEVDGSQVDDSEVDGSQVDDSEVGGSQVDGSEVGGSQVDGSQVDDDDL
jgi:hypothetical protein